MKYRIFLSLLVLSSLTSPLTAFEAGDTIVSQDLAVDFVVAQTAGCRLLPESECRLVSTDPATMKIALASGNIILNIKKLPQTSTFTVETPTAVASVRGTQFWGRVVPDIPDNPAATFAVREGSVEITVLKDNKTFLLHEGQALDILKEPLVSPSVRPALPEELAALEQAPGIPTE